MSFAATINTMHTQLCNCERAGRRQYDKALRMLLYALTAPTMVVNGITMAAHKKFVLVSIIQTGVAPVVQCTVCAVATGCKDSFLPVPRCSAAHTDAVKKFSSMAI